MLPAARRPISPALTAPLFAVIVALGSMYATPRASETATAVNAGLLVVGLVLATVAHEAGHFAMARAVGLRPTAVFLGRGPIVWQRTVRGVRYLLQAVPFTAAVRVVVESPHRLRTRLAAFYAAGPLANAALLAALVPFLSWHDLERGLAREPAPLAAFAIVNAWMLFSNGFPFPATRGSAGLGTDGWQFLAVPFRSDTDLEPLLMGFDLTEALHLVQEGKLPEARALLDDAREKVSEAHAWRVRAVEAEWALASENWPSLAAALTSVLGEAKFVGKLSAPTRGMVANNLAWALFMLDDTTRLVEAERWSTEALATFPKEPGVLGTRGSVLVARGELDAGEQLLRRSLDGSKAPKGRALNACALAIARARAGVIDEAERWIRDARQLDPTCCLLARAEAAVAAARPS